MPKINPSIETYARIKVVGVGGSGKGALNHMIESGTQGVDFISVNADVQDLHHSLSEKKIHIGKNFTKGLGAGMDPEKGRRAAEETKEELQEAIHGADMVFIACGMGGGTGTGAAPVIAKISREEGILTIGVTTRPFFFEGRERMRIAEEGLAELEKEVDAMIVIPNDRILATIDQKTSVRDAFAMCNEVLKQAVEGISDLITKPGTFGNIDFADIRTILQNSGTALMGVGVASGEGRAKIAAQNAINSPLLDISINGARGVLFSISGSEDLSMFEMQEAAKIIYDVADKDARIISGTTIDPEMKSGDVKVTVIATGFPNPHTYSAGPNIRENFGVIKNIEHHNTNSTINTNSDSSNLRGFFSNKTTTPIVAKPVEKKPVILDDKESEDIIEPAIETISNKNQDTIIEKEPNKVEPREVNSFGKTSKFFGKNILSADNQTNNTTNSAPTNKGEIVADISEDDNDDWSSSIPSILRRNR